MVSLGLSLTALMRLTLMALPSTSTFPCPPGPLLAPGPRLLPLLPLLLLLLLSLLPLLLPLPLPLLLPLRSVRSVRPTPLLGSLNSPVQPWPPR